MIFVLLLFTRDFTVKWPREDMSRRKNLADNRSSFVQKKGVHATNLYTQATVQSCENVSGTWAGDKESFWVIKLYVYQNHGGLLEKNQFEKVFNLEDEKKKIVKLKKMRFKKFKLREKSPKRRKGENSAPNHVILLQKIE